MKINMKIAPINSKQNSYKQKFAPSASNNLNKTAPRMMQLPNYQTSFGFFKRKNNEPNLSHGDFIKNNPQIFNKYDRTDYTWAKFFPKENLKVSAWKIHIYSDNDKDWQNMSKVVLPYLINKNVLHKTFNNITPEYLEFYTPKQKGKAFTIYTKSQDEFKQIATELDHIIKKQNLTLQNTDIIGDKALGNSGRIFYRYGFKSKEHSNMVFDITSSDGCNGLRYCEDRNRGENRYLADDMQKCDDPFLNFDPANYFEKSTSDFSSLQKIEKNVSYNMKGCEKLRLPGVELNFRHPIIVEQLNNLGENEQLTIGRDYDCEIKIPEKYSLVSRHHLVILKSNNELYIMDISNNGTAV